MVAIPKALLIPGAHPTIQLLPQVVAPTCAPFMNTTRRAGCSGESASITSRR